MGRTFTLDYKLEAVNYAEINGIKKAARKFHVDQKSIREWRFLKIPTTEFQSDFGIAHHSINLDTKLNAIKYAKENGIEAAAKKFNVDPEGIQNWCNGRYLKGSFKQVPQNKNLACKLRRKSLINVDRNCVKEDIENRLVLWITERLKNNVLITKPMIKVKALELFKSEHKECQETFKASLTWVQEFLVRKKLNISCNNFFTPKFKLNVVKYAKKNGILTAAKEYNINFKYVRDWYNKCNLNAAKKAKTLCAPRRIIQRAFTLDFKLNAIKYAKENGLSAAAEEYNVDRKSIFEWCSGHKLKGCLKLKRQGKSIKNKKCIDVNEESTSNSHFDNCTFNKVTENQFLLNKNDSFSISPKVVLLDIFKQKSKSNASMERSPSMTMMEPNGVKSSSAKKVMGQDSVDSSPSMIMIRPNSEESCFSTKMIAPNLVKSSSSLEVMEPDLVENSTSMIMRETNSVESFPSIKMMKPNSVESLSSVIMRHKKSEKVDKSTSDLKSVKIDSHKIVEASKRKLSKSLPLIKKGHQKSRKVNKPTSDLKSVKIDLHKSVKDLTKKVSMKNMKFKKKLINHVSAYNSHFNCKPSNEVNENQLSIKIKDSFSLYPKVTLLDIFKQNFRSSTSVDSPSAVNHVSSYISQSNSCPSNVVNEDEMSIKIKESFSLNSQSTSAEESFTEIESPLEISCTESEGDSHTNQSVHPLTVQGLIASIAFQTFFHVKPT